MVAKLQILWAISSIKFFIEIPLLWSDNEKSSSV